MLIKIKTKIIVTIIMIKIKIITIITIKIIKQLVYLKN
jgi:hypothetical protein